MMRAPSSCILSFLCFGTLCALARPALFKTKSQVQRINAAFFWGGGLCVLHLDIYLTKLFYGICGLYGLHLDIYLTKLFYGILNFKIFEIIHGEVLGVNLFIDLIIVAGDKS